MSSQVKTWRERISVGAEYPLHAPTDVERTMVAEIAELRAATGVDETADRAAVLAEAVALLPSIMTETFKRDDCSEEFLNGMAYGVASYAAAIKRLAGRPAAVADLCAVCGRTDGGHDHSFWHPRTQQAGADDRDAARYRWLTSGWTRDELAQDHAAGRQPADKPQLAVINQLALWYFTKDQVDTLVDDAMAIAGLQVQHQGAGEAENCRSSEKVQPSQMLTCAPHASQAAAEALSVMLWLYWRLPRGYGRPPFIEQPIEALAKRVGTDVAGCLAERGDDPLAVQWPRSEANDAVVRRQSEASDASTRPASEVQAAKAQPQAAQCPAFGRHQVDWSHDLQRRLIDMGKDQDADVANIMAEAACVLADLTGRPAPGGTDHG